MPRDLAEDAPVPPTDDQDAFRIRMGEERDVRDHLLVGVLVPFGALDDPVEDEDPSVRLRVEDEHVLELGLLVVKDLLDLEGEGLAGPQGSALVKPAVHEQV